MRTPGVSLEPLDGRTSVRAGHLGSLRLLVSGTNGHDVPVTLSVAYCPPAWDVHVVPDTVDLDDEQRQVTATVAYSVPDDAPAGPVEVTIEAGYPDGRCMVTFPIDVESTRRWGKAATFAGLAVGAASGAAYGAWRWLRRR